MRIDREDGMIFYDGDGDNANLHACIIPRTVMRLEGEKHGFAVHLTEEKGDGRAIQWSYGDIDPLTQRMAADLSERWVTGRKVPRKYERR